MDVDTISLLFFLYSTFHINIYLYIHVFWMAEYCIFLCWLNLEILFESAFMLLDSCKKKEERMVAYVHDSSDSNALTRFGGAFSYLEVGDT